MKIKEGDTFLYSYPYEKKHLMLIVSKVISYQGTTKYVCTMVSSWKDNSKLCDPACIINPGEHVFIRHKSYIAYRETILFNEDSLLDLLGNGIAIKKEPISDELLARIKESAKNSRLIPTVMKQFYK